MKILVTAFGPFAGRAENASSLALRGLKQRLPETRTRIFPVDAVIAPSRLKQALKSIRPDVLLMLGEAAGSKQIRLETTAWNELDFTIPDTAGRQPRSRAILAGGVQIYCLTSDFEVHDPTKHSFLDIVASRIVLSDDTLESGVDPVLIGDGMTTVLVFSSQLEWKRRRDEVSEGRAGGIVG